MTWLLPFARCGKERGATGRICRGGRGRSLAAADGVVSVCVWWLCGGAAWVLGSSVFLLLFFLCWTGGWGWRVDLGWFEGLLVLVYFLYSFFSKQPTPVTPLNPRKSFFGFLPSFVVFHLTSIRSLPALPAQHTRF